MWSQLNVVSNEVVTNELVSIVLHTGHIAAEDLCSHSHIDGNVNNWGSA